MSRLAGRSPFSDRYVLQRPCLILRAFRIAARVVSVAPLMLMACGGGGGGEVSSIPTPTPTLRVTGMPSPTVTPSPTPSPSSTPATITYRLTEGSTILFMPPTPGPTPPAPQPLSGTFTVVRSEPQPPNTLFQFTITDMDLQAGPGFSVTSGQLGPFGCAGETAVGCIDATTIDPLSRLRMLVVVSINGQQVGLDGTAPRAGDTVPPVLANVEVCGAAPGIRFVDVRPSTAGWIAATL
jgi:hypothetical protein